MRREMPESEPKPRALEAITPGSPLGWKAVLKSGKQVVVHEIPATTVAAAAAIPRLQRLAEHPHPSLSPVLAWGTEDGGVWVAVEPNEGTPLATVLSRGRFTPHAAATMGLSVLSGVAALHEAGVAMGGFDASTVRLTVNGDVRLAGHPVAAVRGAPSQADLRADVRSCGMAICAAFGVDPAGAPAPPELSPGLVVAIRSMASGAMGPAVDRAMGALREMAGPLLAADRQTAAQSEIALRAGGRQMPSIIPGVDDAQTAPAPPTAPADEPQPQRSVSYEAPPRPIETYSPVARPVEPYSPPPATNPPAPMSTPVPTPAPEPAPSAPEVVAPPLATNPPAPVTPPATNPPAPSTNPPPVETPPTPQTPAFASSPPLWEPAPAPASTPTPAPAPAPEPLTWESTPPTPQTPAFASTPPPAAAPDPAPAVEPEPAAPPAPAPAAPRPTGEWSPVATGSWTPGPARSHVSSSEWTGEATPVPQPVADQFKEPAIAASTIPPASIPAAEPDYLAVPPARSTSTPSVPARKPARRPAIEMPSERPRWLIPAAVGAVALILLGSAGVYFANQRGAHNTTAQNSPHPSSSPKTSPTPTNVLQQVPVYAPSNAAPIKSVQFCTVATPCVAPGLPNATDTNCPQIGARCTVDIGIFYSPSYGGPVSYVLKFFDRCTGQTSDLPGRSSTAGNAQFPKFSVSEISTTVTLPSGAKAAALVAVSQTPSVVQSAPLLLGAASC
jgi:hypothetical protein